MGIRDVFDKSYSVLRGNFKESLLIGIVFWIIAIVVEGSFFLSGMITLDDLYGSGSIQVSVMNLLMASMFAMLSGGVYFAISRVKRSKMNLSDIRKGIEMHWHNIIKAFVLIQVIVFFISQVLNIFMDSYITAATPTYLLFSIILLSVVILVQASIMFALPIVVIEKMDGFRAVKKSIEFFRDNASFVLGSMILVFFIVFAISFTFMSLAVAAVYIMDLSVYLGVPIIVALSMAFVSLIVLAYPCLSIFVVTLYNAGKKKK